MAGDGRFPTVSRRRATMRAITEARDHHWPNHLAYPVQEVKGSTLVPFPSPETSPSASSLLVKPCPFPVSLTGGTE